MPGIMKSGLIKWHLLWMLWLPLFVTGQDLSGEILSITQPGCDPPSIGAISVNGLDGLPPYSYTLDASIIQADGDFSNLVLGNHIIVINDANDAVFTISPTSPINKTSKGCFCLISYSDKDCRQAPQGPTGLSTFVIDELAEITNFKIFTPGNSEPAFQIATRSAHIPDGYAAFS